GLGVIRERGEKGLQVLRDHMVEHRAAGIPRCVGGNGWRHTSPHGQQGENGRARSCPQIYCSFVQYTSKKLIRGWGRNTHGEETRNTQRLAAVVAKERLKFLSTASFTTFTPVTQPFADPDPFHEFTFRSALDAKRAIADHLGMPLAKLAP